MASGGGGGWSQGGSWQWPWLLPVSGPGSRERDRDKGGVAEQSSPGLPASPGPLTNNSLQAPALPLSLGSCRTSVSAKSHSEPYQEGELGNRVPRINKLTTEQGCQPNWGEAYLGCQLCKRQAGWWETEKDLIWGSVRQWQAKAGWKPSTPAAVFRL